MLHLMPCLHLPLESKNNSRIKSKEVPQAGKINEKVAQNISHN